ncbi:MAG: zinc-ribbon domain-containing protein [Promethearchaeota archaeon]
MYCPKCGGKTPEGSNFCRSCGSSLKTFQKKAQKKSYQSDMPQYDRNGYSYWDDSQYDEPDDDDYDNDDNGDYD